MSDRWEEMTSGFAGPFVPQELTYYSSYVPVGPGPAVFPDPDTTVWETNLAFRADHPDLLMQLQLKFDGVRAQLVQLLVGSTVDPQRNITPATVARLRVAEAVRAACVITVRAAADLEEFRDGTTAVDPEPRHDRRATDAELRLLAGVYAFEFAAWGDPRKAVMRTWGLPRSTANGWIRRAAELVGGLPGVGANRG